MLTQTVMITFFAKRETPIIFEEQKENMKQTLKVEEVILKQL